MKRILITLCTLTLLGLGYLLLSYHNLKVEPISKIQSTVSSDLKKYDLNSLTTYFDMKHRKHQEGKYKLDAPEEFAKLERAKRTPRDRTSPEYVGNNRIDQLKKAQKRNTKSAEDLNFIERGPGNVAGRTRAILVLPNDPEGRTWIAGSTSGGIWKTTDLGRNWVDKTPDLPNLGTNTLAMSKSNSDIIYAGTGEFFTSDIDGVGMFKSTDEGETWNQIVAPGDYDAFRNVSRIVVHPEDPDIVIASTRNSLWEDSLRAAVYKSIDGGMTWDQKLISTTDRYDDLDANPENFNTLYLAVRNKGVFKSTDQGETWVDKSDGLQVTGRIEITTTPVDTNFVWGGAQGSASGSGSDLYISKDGAETWKLAVVDNDDAKHFLTNQGWYDNAIAPSPFYENVVYVGGVNLFKMSVSDSDVITVSYDIQDNGAFEFLDFINGARVGGGIIAGDLEPTEVVSIELRFGVGGQKAHRFSVNGRGAGVPAADYVYQDLVDVPFQVWDVTNNIQLMASFRDQGDDGEWTLKERILDSANTPNDSREYIFPQNVPYADSAHADIAIAGGHEHRQLFLMWPVLRSGETFNPSSEVRSSFSILAEQREQLSAETTVVSDAYGDFNGNNSFTSAEFSNNRGHHPDQHSIQTIVFDSLNRFFRLLTTNDGGVYVTNPSKDPGVLDDAFTYAGYGYNTSQFYGADKMPGESRYMGGMQDNSTWFTARGDTGSANTFYEFAVGGDGFEVIWNNRDPDLMIGSIQFNNFQRSTDGGLDWNSANSGYSDQGPFLSRLANSRALPDRIFTVGESGVWYSNNFGGNWESSPIPSTSWSFNNGTDIEVSPANPDIVWAGGALDEFQRFFASRDGGISFEQSSYYQDVEMGRSSGLSLHPVEEETAYALFSFARRPKVLRTTDFGATWEDISGFDGATTVSTRGFPDVATNSLLVFPNDPNRIWVGSEIGIIESLDNGATWNILDSNLPAVNIFDMKIQDDQIILATYGRGIWSIKMEGLEQSYIFPPAITAVAINPNGSINVGTDLSSDFDSLQFLVDNNSIGLTIPETPLGSYNLALEGAPLEDGEYTFHIVGYNDGTAYKSLPYQADIFKPGIPTETYFNDFSVDSLKDDFVGSGFRVRTAPGFDDPAIHSDHDYNDNGEITYLLKTPIIVADDQTFKYRDIVIVEPGEQLSRFGQESFFDYVVAEGSSDGINWEPLADGYDSSFDPDWQAAYNAEQIGLPDLWVEHEVILENTFSLGEIIFIRYRLFADPFVNGWGWAIDNVAVELENSTPVFDVSFETLSIYPNPTSDVLYIQLPEDKKSSEIVLRDLQGRAVKHVRPGKTTKVEVPTSALNDGVYFIEIYDEGNLVASEKVVVVK